MPYCETCVHFRTDNDCDGPAEEWCNLGYREDTSCLGSQPACRVYVEAEEEYDWDD